jgi:predicted nucleic acid-binding protein
MILYLDTSALVKLYVAEEGSETVRRAVEAADTVATSRVAYAEARAALAMASRLGRITEEERAAAAAVFRSDWPLFSVVNVSQSLVELAAELAEAKALRGFDAIHLASSVLLLQRTAEPVHFMAWDRPLVRAARDLGLAVDGAAD